MGHKRHVCGGTLIPFGISVASPEHHWFFWRRKLPTDTHQYCTVSYTHPRSGVPGGVFIEGDRLKKTSVAWRYYVDYVDCASFKILDGTISCTVSCNHVHNQKLVNKQECSTTLMLLLNEMLGLGAS